MKQYTLETISYNTTMIKTYVNGKLEKEIELAHDLWVGAERTLDSLGYERAFSDEQIKSKERTIRLAEYELNEMKKKKVKKRS